MRPRTILLLLLVLLLPITAQAFTRYASPGGGGDCSSPSSPCSLTTGISQTSAGDTLYLRGGSYGARIDSEAQTIPSGTSWSNPVTIASYPGETAILEPSTGSSIINLNGWNAPSDIQYIIFDRLLINAANAQYGITYASNPNGNQVHHVRFQNGEVANATANRGCTGGGTDGNNVSFGGHHNEFLNSNIHHSACSYGFYNTGFDNLIDGCYIHDNAGYGIQNYDSGSTSVSNNIYRNNIIDRNSQTRPMGAITVNSGSNNQIYNNVITNTVGLGGIEIGFNPGTSNTQVYNNVICGNNGPAIHLGGNGAGAVIANNIICGDSSQVQNDASGTGFNANVCGSAGGVCAIGGIDDQDFVSRYATPPDMHLTQGSEAINCCPRLAGVTTDMEGTSRSDPTTAGPFESNAAPPPPNPDPGTLLAHWTFDEGIGTNAADTAPEPGDYPCTLTSAGWVSPGIIGASAFSLNGSRSCQISGVPQQANLALSLWLNGTVLPTAPPAATSCLFTIGETIQVCINSTGHLTFTVYTNTYHTITSPTVVQNGAPRHIVVSYHPTDAQRMWDNGAQAPSAAPTGNLTYPGGDTSTQIGRYSTNNAYAYTGVIDQVRAYAAPLVQADVNNLFNELVPTGGTAVHDMAFYNADAAEGINGAVNVDLSSPLTTPKRIRFGLRNATGVSITEYFRPFCRVDTGSGYGAWAEVDNSFGSDGIRFHTDTVKNLGDATTNLLPLDGATAAAGKFILDTVDLTSPYDAAQKITVPNGGQADIEIGVDFGSPLAAGHKVQCKPHRESGADLTEYGNPIAIRELTIQGAPIPSALRVGVRSQGGTTR